MKEIKFRGFQTYENKWVYGYLVVFGVENRIYYGSNEKDYSIVRGESVSQFTGCKDNNGMDIYDGDELNSECNGRGVVQWDNDNSTFQVFVWENPSIDQFFFLKGYGVLVGSMRKMNKYGEHEYNNTVIEVRNKAHGKKVIQFWKEQGVDTGRLSGEMSNDYYGLVDGLFGSYSYIPSHIRVLTISEGQPEKQPQRGDSVMVWDDGQHPRERIYLGTIEGAEYPHLTVANNYESRFREAHKGYAFKLSLFKFMKPLEDNIVELTLQDISDGKGVGINPKLIKIKKDV